MFHAASGASIWQPEMTRFLQEIGLPSGVRSALAQSLAAPPATPGGCAAIDDESRLPVQSTGALRDCRFFLRQKLPRAFALGSDGGWGPGWGGADPRGRAIANCGKRADTAECHLHAVDGAVVWNPQR